ncbi:2-succinyl-5-enolpyruvyl-6-hydroxy-3-cyclohexene-1-carboxylic-acid synthase [Azospirillum canadense]|uniref:2-succinyl-5-enolpyruvyl-6-hydroxy-3- cyclohexene-1-carboxylic-acid synthase n=1 Tax=Azospirillum canadense TaxID=403962 RepID=UPI002227524E|nr:2-succinyl-5-enolpyruvyl-6-hydroxy-3-cyclohexene-1-carboxylic-acid synthase [Azospirillum canadense]MCW2240474.1 2-succinyl-5-enolpyruvyl-6-hydroxy-3-cyclohexene-1-carboxylate synthase [Azospirillum canadense]
MEGIVETVRQRAETQTSARHSVEIDNTSFRGIVQGDADLNFQWAAVLIDSLVACGVTHAVMSPGAQMAPLSLACRANPEMTVSVVIDERSAAFLALGLARATRRPTVLICTSGSATGQWYPAVMEASAGQTPLILLTADRAPENQDRSSAQAIDQIKLYGSHVRASHHLPPPDASIAALVPLMARAYEQSLWPAPGPVHINVPFRDPFIPQDRSKLFTPQPATVSRPQVSSQPTELREIAERIAGRPGVIVSGAGELDGDAAAAIISLAETLACPVIADPLSNLRFDPAADDHVIAGADSFLRSAAFAGAHHPGWVLSVGGPPTSKPLLRWLQNARVADYIVVDPSPRWPDPLLRATRLLRASPAALCRDLATAVGAAPAAHGWLTGFVAADRAVEAGIARVAGVGFWEAQIVRRLIAAAANGSALFSGNSMAVRDFDSFSGKAPRGLRLLANRGTNGIDGNVGTFLGIAAAQRGVTTLGLIGDMAFAHDVGSLQMAGDLDVVLVVGNNGGGAIFDYLATAKAPEYADFLAPPSIDIRLAAEAAGWRTWRAEDAESFDATFVEAMRARGPRLIEAVIDRAESVASHKAFWTAMETMPAHWNHDVARRCQRAAGASR